MASSESAHFGTLAIHVGQEPDQWNSRAVVPPIVTSTTFAQDSPGEHRGFDYSRCGNPSRSCFEACMAALDGAKHCIATSSGTSALALIVLLLKSGDNILCGDDVYGGITRYFNKVAAPQTAIDMTYVNPRDLDKLQTAIKPNTKLVWLETPTNPLMTMTDIQKVADVVHQHKDILLVVENTLMTPYFQVPLSLGADIVMTSISKFMNGHSDVIMGVITTNDDEVNRRLRFLQYAVGPVPSPFDCYLANRSLKTLHIRMKQHQYNAMAVAESLEKNSRVDKVFYPGLKSHPQHELATKQMKGFGGMVSFCIKGNLENSRKFLTALKYFTLGESFGAVESLAEHPLLMTHKYVPEEEIIYQGITENLIRLSVGLEEVEDLIEDLYNALKVAVPDPTSVQ